jgi:hypothetical protein
MTSLTGGIYKSQSHRGRKRNGRLPGAGVEEERGKMGVKHWEALGTWEEYIQEIQSSMGVY